MRILIVGNLGYIGPVLTKHLKLKYPGCHLIGYDIGYFTHCTTTKGPMPDIYLDTQYYGDVRQFDENCLSNIDAVVYLAAISNDPMGNVFQKPTYEINCDAAVTMASMAKAKGVQKFIFASSCSVYGYADGYAKTEDSSVMPLTAYAESKIKAETLLEPLADTNFEVCCLRFATACGFSDRLRLDLVLNDFVASALLLKKIEILSDGTPWRPLIHVSDMALAIDWAIHNAIKNSFLVMNTGSNRMNVQVKGLAEEVSQIVSNVEVNINKDAQPDKRSYKVSFELFEKLAPEAFQPKYDLAAAIKDLVIGLEWIGFSDNNFRNSSLIRLNVLQSYLANGVLDKGLSFQHKS
ncbi:NAD-dependent epimerase/dehydratase family protein [Parasediminibacterium sp. JCM 36343]|uniref:NAD-dependent epimerase/dehydratase family protein n=1 Tax=Parasediminibacterium sp. JCM 36343 TaxID=3374279 RepID=UPI00397920F0